jgi:hypothetical protein
MYQNVVKEKMKKKKRKRKRKNSKRQHATWADQVGAQPHEGVQSRVAAENPIYRLTRERVVHA